MTASRYIRAILCVWQCRYISPDFRKTTTTLHIPGLLTIQIAPSDRLKTHNQTQKHVYMDNGACFVQLSAQLLLFWTLTHHFNTVICLFKPLTVYKTGFNPVHLRSPWPYSVLTSLSQDLNLSLRGSSSIPSGRETQLNCCVSGFCEGRVSNLWVFPKMKLCNVCVGFTLWRVAFVE